MCPSIAVEPKFSFHKVACIEGQAGGGLEVVEVEGGLVEKIVG